MSFMNQRLAAVLLLALASTALFALPAAAQAHPVPVSLSCPLFGGTCEAFPQLDGLQYFFQSQGNAIITAITPVTSPVTRVSCLPLLRQTGSVTVTIVTPDGQRATTSAAVCPGRPVGGPIFPF